MSLSKRTEIHIGEIIAGKLTASGMSKSELARRINKARQNINDILNRRSVDTALLFDISQALDHNFFQYYVENLRENGMEDLSSDPDPAASIKILSLEREKEFLRKDLELANTKVGYLEEINQMLRSRMDPTDH